MPLPCLPEETGDTDTYPGLGALNTRTCNTIVIIAMLLTVTFPLTAVAMPVHHGAAVPQATAAARLEAVGAPVGFLENAGQFPDAGVALYQGLDGGGIAFATSCVVLNLEERPESGLLDGMRPGMDPREHRAKLADAMDDQLEGHTVRLVFEGANDVVPEGRDVLPGKYNWFIGDDPAAWRTGVRAYSRVVYEDLWEGVDLVYSLAGDGLKYEFVLAPGADASIVRVGVEGSQGVSVRDGDLVISTSLGDIVDGGLAVFHQGSSDRPLPASFVALGDSTYGFSVGGRDPDRTLVIDPWVFSTYLGGNSDDIVYRIELDGDGEIYALSMTDSGNFPTTAGAYMRSLPGWNNLAITKLQADGSALVFSTFMGGDTYEESQGMCIDRNEDIYICGMTYSSDYPVTPGVYQNESISGPFNFTSEGFVTKLDASGARLDYSTYLGTDAEDSLYAIAVDANGRAYVTGYTDSFNMTCSAGAYQSTKMGGDWYWDAIVRVLDATASNQVYATYLGGDDDDEGWDIALTDAGVVYITGYTYSWDFPVTQGAYQTDSNWAWTTGFVTKFKSDLTGLHYSTYLGGSDDQELYALDLNADGNATVTGYTYSSDYPVTAGAYDTSIGMDDVDVVVSQLSADGSKLVYSTFLGGGSEEYGYDVRIDSSGKAHVCGYTYSNDFPTTAGAISGRLKGDMDGFYAVLTRDLSDLDMGTYVGGSSEDIVTCIGPPEGINATFGGGTISTDYPTTNGAFQVRHGGGDIDGVLGKISFDSISPIAVAGDDVVIDQHETVDFDGSGSSDNIQVINWTWTFRYGGRDRTLFGERASFTFDDAGSYEVTLKVTDSAFLEAFDQLTVTVRDITAPTAEAGKVRYIEQGDNVIFDGTKSADNVGVANWTWTFEYDGRTVKLYGADPDFTFDEAGVYNVTLTVTDAVGLTATDWVHIYVKDVSPPSANAGIDVEIDQHQTAVLDAVLSSDNVGIVNWTWGFVYRGQPVSLFGERVEYTFDNAGTYEVTLSVEDAEGNRALDTLSVRVRDITPPVADAGEDTEVVQGTTVYLDATGSSDNVRISTYKWTFMYQGVEIELEGSAPHYYFGDAGVYEVTLTVTDLQGNPATDTVTVNVRDTQDPVAEAGADLTVDQGDEVTFDGLGCDDNVGVATWTWAFTYGGSERELTGSSPSFTFGEAGVYVVTLTVADAAGNSADDEGRVTVRDTTAPLAVAGDDRTVDQGTPVSLDATGSSDNVGVTRFIWSFTYGGSPEELVGKTVQFTFDVPGDYTITLTARDAAGNSATDSFDLHVRDTVRPTPPAMSSIEAGPGEKVTFDASGALDNVGVVKWTWTFKEGGKTVTLEGERVTHTFDEAGDYEVTLTVEDAEGNQGTTTFDVTVSGGAWLWIAIIIVIVVLVAVAMFAMRGRGAKPVEEPEEAPQEGQGDIIVEERYAK